MIAARSSGDDRRKRFRRFAEQRRPVRRLAGVFPVETPGAGEAIDRRFGKLLQDLPVGEQRPCPAVRQRPAEVLRRSHVVQRNRDRADRGEREAQHHLRVAVDADHADRNAVAEAAPDQPAGERERVAVQAAIASGLHARLGEGDDRRGIAEARQIVDQGLQRAVHGDTPVRRRAA